jgi:hypothetical protein
MQISYLPLPTFFSAPFYGSCVALDSYQAVHPADDRDFRNRKEEEWNMTIASGYETKREQSYELHWLRLASRPIFLRSTIVAVVLGSILTLINQPGWVSGSAQLQLLPLILVFLTPFAVVMVAQVAGVRQAHIDSAGQKALGNPEGFITTITSHGIPARAAAIGLVFGSMNAILSVADEISRSGDLAAVDVAPLGQAYVLPLVFGLVTQAISYRRSRYQATKANQGIHKQRVGK